MKTGTCLAILLLLPSVLQAGMQVDSLYASAQAETSDSLRVSKLCDLSRDLYSQNPRRGLEIGLEVIEVSRSLGDSLGLMRAHYCLGLNHWSLGEYGPALESYEESLVLARLLNEAKMEMMLENNLGVTFNARGDYLSALRYFHDSLRHQDSAGVEWMKPHTLLNIGNIHEYLGNHEEAILQFEQCADLLGDTNDLFLASIYNNLGVSYEQSGDFARAKDYQNRSREIREREGDEYAISTNLINLATILNQQGHHAEAIPLLEDALQRVQDFGDESSIVDIQIIWASSLCALSRHEEAIHRLEESLRISENTGRGEELVEIHRLHASCLVELDDLEAAYDHLVRSSELQDSLISQDRVREMSIAEDRYERERESSQRELERLRGQQEIEEELRQAIKIRKAQWMIGLFLLFLVAGIYTLNRMRLSRNRVLCAFNEELQSRVDQQTLQLREEVSERKKAEQEQIRLSAHLIEAREKERRKVARDIHDELGQSLTAVNMDLARISGEVDDLQRRDLGETRKLVTRVIQQIRTLITDLRPTVLETLGLSGGLLWLGENFEERFPFTVSADVEDCSFCCGESETVALFRIAQEALNNVARHADADTVSLRLFREGDSMCLEIEDDGNGFDPNVREVLSSFGIMGMRERARALGSELKIRSRPGEGSCLSVTVNRVEK